MGGNAPGDYLPKIQREAGLSSDEMDAILAKHLIDPAMLRANDFNGFFAARREAMLRRIERAMGKSVAGTGLLSPADAGTDGTDAARRSNVRQKNAPGKGPPCLRAG